MVRKREKKILLGLGLDHKDGHKRVTKGENFLLCGGSKDTHEAMQEKAIKLNEALKKRRKTLEQVGVKEFSEIAAKVGLYPVSMTQKSLRQSGEML